MPIGYSWNNIEVYAAVGISTLLFIVFWDGSRKKLPAQGGIAILINAFYSYLHDYLARILYVSSLAPLFHFFKLL